MSRSDSRNLAASVRQRLLNLARERGEDFNFLLTAYGLERLMYRLGQSGYRREFVLKGAMLFRAWAGATYRPTRDLDLLGRGEAGIPRLERLFNEVWQAPAPADGLELEPGSLRGEEIRDTQEYGGIRIRMTALLGSARIPLQVDIGFGDAVTPAATEITFPALLDAPPPVLYAYPPETVVAEKLQAMVALGVVNTRMKDFYDVWVIARRGAPAGGGGRGYVSSSRHTAAGRTSDRADGRVLPGAHAPSAVEGLPRPDRPAGGRSRAAGRGACAFSLPGPTTRRAAGGGGIPPPLARRGAVVGARLICRQRRHARRVGRSSGLAGGA